MTTKVQKWGNSLAVRLPRGLAAEAHLAAGTEVELKVQDGEIVIAPTGRRTYSLARLLRKVSKDNIPDEAGWGEPVGREAW